MEVEEQKNRCDQKVMSRLGQRIMVVQDYDKN